VHDEFQGFLAQSSTNAHSLAHLREFVREIGRAWGQQADTLRTKRELAERRAKEQLQELIRMKVDRLISDDEFRIQRTALAGHQGKPDAIGADKPFGVDAVLRDLELVGDRLINLVDAWKHVATRFQRRFQQITIPEGYIFGRVGTAQKGRLLSFLESPLPVDTNAVPPTWESWNQLMEEIQSLAVIFGENNH
jgi:hypothetical protein